VGGHAGIPSFSFCACKQCKSCHTPLPQTEEHHERKGNKAVSHGQKGKGRQQKGRPKA